MKCIQCYKKTNSKLDIGYCKVPLCNDCKRLTERLRGTWGIPFHEAITLKDEDIMKFGFK
jgi:NAD-dependent SIR2 family protein deacetylase